MNEQFTPVKLSRPVILKPASTRSVPIHTSFNSDQEEGFIERSLATNLGNNDLYGIADSLIAKSYPYIQMSHFSQRFVKLPKGHIIGHMTDPKKGLNYAHDIPKEDLQASQAKAKLINALAVEEPPPEISEEDILLSEAVEGGPKTSEVPDYSPIPKEQILSEAHFGENLSPEQRRKMEEIVLKHQKAFGLDGQLGNYPADA